MIGFTLWSESLSLEFPTWYTTYLICNTHFHFSNSTEQLSLSQFPSMMEFLPTYLICNNRFSNSTNQLSLSQFPSMMEFLPIYLICNIHFHFFQFYKTTFTFPIIQNNFHFSSSPLSWSSCQRTWSTCGTLQNNSHFPSSPQWLCSCKRI